MFAMVAALIKVGEQLGGKRNVLCSDNNAAARASIKASSRAPAVLVLIESFWGCVAQLSAAYWVERVSSEANPADAPGRDTRR